MFFRNFRKYYCKNFSDGFLKVVVLFVFQPEHKPSLCSGELKMNSTHFQIKPYEFWVNFNMIFRIKVVSGPKKWFLHAVMARKGKKIMILLDICVIRRWLWCQKFRWKKFFWSKNWFFIFCLEIILDVLEIYHDPIEDFLDL